MSKHYLSAHVLFTPDVKADAERYWGPGEIQTFKIPKAAVDAFWNKTQFSLLGAFIGHPFVHRNQITLHVRGIGPDHFTGGEHPPHWDSKFSFLSDAFLESFTTPVKKEDKSLKVYLRRNVYDSLFVSGELVAILCKDIKGLPYIFFCSGEIYDQCIAAAPSVPNGPNMFIGINEISFQPSTTPESPHTHTICLDVSISDQDPSNRVQVAPRIYASTAAPAPDGMGGAIPGARIPV